MKLRDLLAIPFVTLGGVFLFVGVIIGGSWTASQLLSHPLFSDVKRKS